MSVVLVSPPAREPLHLDEAKAHLRTLGSTDGDADTLISSLIRAAREVAESDGRVLVTQTFEQAFDHFPGCLTLLRWPVQSVSSVTYLDAEGVVQTLATDRYVLETRSRPARIDAAYLQPWPSTRAFRSAVKVRFVAGYATPVTIDATANTLTALGRTFADGDAIELTNSGGALPGALSELTTYYVVSASGSTFSVSATSGGSAIDLTSAGTGATFVGRIPESLRQAVKLLVAQFHEFREPVVSGTIATEIPFTVRALLGADDSGYRA